MKLYLMRHGEYSPDPRLGGGLSDQGKIVIQRMANFLGHANVRVASIIHSGKLRTQQTAEIVAAALALEQPLIIHTGLDPADLVDPFIAELAHEDSDCLVVGHLPFMSRLTAKLLTENESDDIVMFQPGTLACLERINADRWIIDWVLSAELFSHC